MFRYCFRVVDFNVLLFVSGCGYVGCVYFVVFLLFCYILLLFFLFLLLFLIGFSCCFLRLWVYSGVLLFRAILLYSTMYGLYCDWREWFVSVCLHVRS